MYTAFISYRRDHGGTFALLLEEKLKQLGFSVFLDHKSMHAGRFDDEIATAIKESTDFIALLSKNCFHNRKGHDFFIDEISCAIAENKNIIPILLNDFNDSDNVPECIASILNYQGVKQQDPKNFDSVFIPELISFMSDSNDKRSYISQHSNRSFLSSRELIERESLAERWRDAVEIDICAYFANMLINTDIIERALESGVKIRYLIVDPNSDAAREAVKYRLKRTKMSRFVQSYEAAKELLEDLNYKRSNDPTDPVLNGTFEIRKTSLFISNAIMIVKKKDSKKNAIKVDFYTFDTDDSTRRSIMITSYDVDNYQFFENQFEYIWASDRTEIVLPK